MTEEEIEARKLSLRDQISRLEKIRTSGVTRVTHEGRTVEYRDDNAILAAMRAAREELDALDATGQIGRRRRLRAIYPVTDRGGYL